MRYKSYITNVGMRLFIYIVNCDFIYISDFCCESHVNDSLDVKLECIHYMNELIDCILSNTVVGDDLSQLSLM
jgi:hypothetical protein